MIDRKTRDTASQALRRLVAGEITNDEFDDAWPHGCDDAGIEAVYAQIWKLFDDLHEHRLVGEWAPTGATRELVERCIWFLESEVAYHPPRSLVARIQSWFTDDGVWPFASVEERDSARPTHRRYR